MDAAKLRLSFAGLMDEGQKAGFANTRIGYLAAVEKFKEAASVADLIGGMEGSYRRANADQLLSSNLFNLHDMDGAARAACSSLRAARASGHKSMLVTSLSSCGYTARQAPSEMVNAERASREQERLSGGSPSYGGLDLWQDGRISLPTTLAGLSRMGLAYNEAAVAICDAELAAAGGRGSPAAADPWRFPSLNMEARARGYLGACLNMPGEEQRSLELLRQAVALWRQILRTAAPGEEIRTAQRMLANELCNLGFVLKGHGSDGMAEAEACLREALALSEGLGDVLLTGKILTYLINLCGEAHATVGPAEAEAFRSRLNQLFVDMERSPETSCSICLEPLAPPADGAAEDAAGGGGSGGVGGPADSCLRVMSCNHQFHHGCLWTWQRTTSNCTCPICKK